MPFVFLISAALTAAPAPAAPPAYLFDALRGRSPFRPAWEKLMKEVQPTPDWLRQFTVNFDGVSGSLTAVDVGGKSYLLSFVCKPADCEARKFTVLFDAAGAHAFGALGGAGQPPEFFGKPSPAEQDALAKGF